MAWKAGTGGIIRRNLRNASMTGLSRAGGQACSEHGDGLESVKKPIKLRVGSHPGLKASRKAQSVAAGLARRTGDPILPDFSLTATRPAKPSRVTRLGYAIDDGPRNEAPGDADRGVARRSPDRPDRDVLVPQPGHLAAGGGGANPGRDRPRSGGPRHHRRFGFSRQLCLLS